jgi:anti-sigma B factor antagonist
MSQPCQLAAASPPGVTNFAVSVRPDREIVVLEVCGELCLASAGELAEAIEEVANGFEQLVLDLREVTFMDSTGVRLLIETEARARVNSLSFAVLIEGGQPHRVLELLGMSDRPPRIAARELQDR